MTTTHPEPSEHDSTLMYQYLIRQARYATTLHRRVKEARAILSAIDEGELLTGLAVRPEDLRRYEAALSLLVILSDKLAAAKPGFRLLDVFELRNCEQLLREPNGSGS